MRFKFVILIFLVVFLIASISIGNLGTVISFYKDTALLNFLDASYRNDRYPRLNVKDFSEVKMYLNEIIDVEMREGNIKEAINNNLIIADAMGFVTENAKSQIDIMHKFPYGLFVFSRLVSDLKAKDILPPYGNFNNNFLTKDGLILYSDDIDMMKLTSEYIASLDSNELYDKQAFQVGYLNVLKNHWYEMKESGSYGEDGLFFGPRGYTKNALLVFSFLNPQHSDLRYNNIWPTRLGNGSLIRSPVIGLDRRLSEKQAFTFGEYQSYTTHAEKDIAISAGALAATVRHFLDYPRSSKMDIIKYFEKMIEKEADDESEALDGISLGRNLHTLKANPIIVYNNIPGFVYNEMIALVVYSFLQFDNLAQALKAIVHTPGDNDSLVCILAFLYALHDEKVLPDYYLKFLEAKNIKFLN
jgi:ADP-ribosylglycohydrolase